MNVSLLLFVMISIHALREEGDNAEGKSTCQVK